ncbi:hypothetical protein HYFRA_00011630 [Hymenoscyphus fraxineus]|uniref:Uncharacterized protein n=1 Tax=Hymenoscyphus fraxineus TaxID=746836 RepID=A0A9N9PVN4_9HELO|nr:hypothetical protein HYFRA_00011630 [Hymenoscyphus fraxineus]
MHFTARILLLFSAAASIKASWTVPADQPDGVYSVSVDEAGIAHHELLEPPTVERRAIVKSAKFSPKPALFSRADITINLNHGDTDAVVNNLKSQCGSGGVMGAHLSYYAKSGQALAYFCNHYSHSNTCYTWEVQDNLVGLGSQVCGSYAASAVYLHGKEGTYGQDVVTARFC